MALRPHFDAAMQQYADNTDILVATVQCDENDDAGKLCEYLQANGNNATANYAVPTVLYGSGASPKGFVEFAPSSIGKDYESITTQDIVNFITKQFGPPAHGPKPPSPSPPPTPPSPPPTPPGPKPPSPSPPSPSPPSPAGSKQCKKNSVKNACGACAYEIDCGVFNPDTTCVSPDKSSCSGDIELV